jgi:nitroimidazol reductase NimA-like FMN-containing flavoprotein (pyridoxamine 5'-phosphate oxidase superfamily)
MSGAETYATDHTGLRILSLEDCLGRLAQTAVGRIAFPLDGELAILPVAHTMDGVDVCFRTTGDSKIQAAIDHDRVAYEVDGFDPRTRTGWSVLVQGTAVIEDDEDSVRRLDGIARLPWVVDPVKASTWVRVRSQSITGRELGDAQ